MRIISLILIIVLANYILCQTLQTTNIQSSSSNNNGVTTTTETVTNTYNNGSTVIIKTETTGTTVTKTVTVQTGGNSNYWVSTYTISGTNNADTATPVLQTTNTQTSSSNGINTEIVTNTYNNGSTVVTKTETNGNTNTITKTVTVTSGGNTNTWTSTTTGTSNSGTGNNNTPSPAAPAPTPAPTVAAPAPAAPAPTPAPTVSAPAPSPSNSGTGSSNSGSGNDQNPVTLASNDPYYGKNYAIPSSVSYSDIKRVHLEYINGARDCMNVGNLTWDDALAAHAQVWANTCNIFHANANTDPANPLGTVNTIGEGENIYVFEGSSMTALLAMQKGNEFFNGEAASYDCASNSCSGTCGHYTQNVWKETTKLGCGVAVCGPNKFYGVCRYFPRGNFNFPQVHVLGSAQACNNGQGFDACKARIAASGRALTSTTTNTNTTSRFFTSDSQIVVFALVITIAVLVAAILVVLLVSSRRRTANKDLEYQLLETK